MLRSNLAILLAERNLKITKVSNDTGISRTTLTALTSNACQGIQFDTLNTLCTYLNITPEQLITFYPMDIKISNTRLIKLNSKYKNCNIDLEFLIREYGHEIKDVLSGAIYPELSDDSSNAKVISAEIWMELPELNFRPKDEELPAIVRAFKKLPIPFLNDINNEIIDNVCMEFYRTYSERIRDVRILWKNDEMYELKLGR